MDQNQETAKLSKEIDLANRRMFAQLNAETYEQIQINAIVAMLHSNPWYTAEIG